MENLFGFLAGFLFILVILVIGAYIVQGIILTKLNKLMFNKGTPMAWIPIANIYLLGKLTVNKIVGWILVIVCILSLNFSVTVNGNESTYGILPENFRSILSIIYSIAIFALFIYAIVKYIRLKKGVANSSNSLNDLEQTPGQIGVVLSDNQAINNDLSNEQINLNQTVNNNQVVKNDDFTNVEPIQNNDVSNEQFNLNQEIDNNQVVKNDDFTNIESTQNNNVSNEQFNLNQEIDNNQVVKNDDFTNVEPIQNNNVSNEQPNLNFTSENIVNNNIKNEPMVPDLEMGDNEKGSVSLNQMVEENKTLNSDLSNQEANTSKNIDNKDDVVEIKLDAENIEKENEPKPFSFD